MAEVVLFLWFIALFAFVGAWFGEMFFSHPSIGTITGAVIGAIIGATVVIRKLTRIRKFRKKFLSGNPVEIPPEVMNRSAVDIFLNPPSIDELPDIAAEIRKREEAKKGWVQVSFEEALQVSDEIATSLGEPLPPWLSHISVEPDEVTGFSVEIGVAPSALAVVLEAHKFPESVRNVPLRVRGIERGRAIGGSVRKSVGFGEILNKMVIELDVAEMEQPFSLREDGKVASLGEMIDAKAPLSVRQALGRKSIVQASPVRLIASLTELELKIIVIELIRGGNPNEHLATGNQSFSPQQLVDEVTAGSAVGEQFVAAIRQHSLFLEKAVESGRIRLKQPGDAQQSDAFEFPDLDDLFK